MNNIKSNKKELSPEQREKLLKVLKARFEKNMHRHNSQQWAHVQAKLEANPEKLWSLGEMERTGGEPDIVEFDKKTGDYIFYDCSAENPNSYLNFPVPEHVSQREQQKIFLVPCNQTIETGLPGDYASIMLGI